MNLLIILTSGLLSLHVSLTLGHSVTSRQSGTTENCAMLNTFVSGLNEVVHVCACTALRMYVPRHISPNISTPVPPLCHTLSTFKGRADNPPVLFLPGPLYQPQ